MTLKVVQAEDQEAGQQKLDYTGNLKGDLKA
jgi:hypothetical protein